MSSKKFDTEWDNIRRKFTKASVLIDRGMHVEDAFRQKLRYQRYIPNNRTGYQFKTPSHKAGI